LTEMISVQEAGQRPQDKPRVQVFIDSLIKEFGPLNESYLKMAVVHYVEESTKFQSEIPMDVLKGLEIHVLGALKVQVETDLGKQQDIMPVITDMATINQQLTLLRHK